MPPELLAHFKKKQGSNDDSAATPEEQKERDKERRKEAVRKSRTRLEEKSRRPKHDENKETGKKRA